MMKKILVILLFLLTIQASVAQQQKLRFGVSGGLNYTQVENFAGGYYAQFDRISSWQIGVAAQYKWGGFLNYAIQPELRYLQSSTYVEPVIGPDFGVLKLHAVELPINFQFGMQLSKIFRPFVQATAYVSCIVGQDAELLDKTLLPLNRFNLGLGAGLGFDLWKCQFQFNYRWGLTNINQNKEAFDKLLLGGFELSVGYYF